MTSSSSADTPWSFSTEEEYEATFYTDYLDLVRRYLEGEDIFSVPSSVNQYDIFKEFKDDSVWRVSNKLTEESSFTSEQGKLQSQTATLTDACQADTDLAKKTFISNFLLLLHESDFEYGFKTKADYYVQDAIDNYGTFAREWINEVFLQYFDKPEIITLLLRVISQFDYQEMYPAGMTMAAAAINHTDVEVRECGVRCFENWEAPENLHILRKVTYEEEWLSEYLQGVIEDLERIN